MNGMVFDPGFAPDFHLIARRGGSTFDLDVADLNESNFDFFPTVITVSAIPASVPSEFYRIAEGTIAP